MLKKAFFLMCLIGGGASVGFAQEQLLPLHGTPTVLAKKAEMGFPKTKMIKSLHITDQLVNSEEGQRTLAGFREWKKNGGQALLKKESPAKLGDTLAFRVRDFKNNRNITLKFRLERVHDQANFWVELGEIAAKRIRSTALDSVVAYMTAKTPAFTDKGIIQTDQALFGQPPNSDNDGKLDALLYNIPDNYDPEGNASAIAGYVSPQDLPGAGGNGNNRDIIHLDTYPSLNNGIAELMATAAHEYQHLIRINYDNLEVTFVDEGLSEWAELYNGFSGRLIYYLSTFSIPTIGFSQVAENNVYLLDWRTLSSGNDNLTQNDYQRAGLFTTYMAEQVGAENTGAITRDTATGLGGYRNALSKNATTLSLETLVHNWHTANLVNSYTLDPRFGYQNRYRRSFFRNVTYDGDFDGASATEKTQTTAKIQPGGVTYFRWNTVKDFKIQIDPVADAGGTLSDYRSVTRARLILKAVGGTTQVKDLTLGTATETITGEFTSVSLLISNVNPSRGSGYTPAVRFVTSWSSELATASTEVKYGENALVHQDTDSGAYYFFALGGNESNAAATRFLKPTNAVRLQKVSVSPYYRSQDSSFGISADAPRDIKLTVWQSNSQGLPGDVLFELDVTDPRAYDVPRVGFNFFEIDLTAHESKLNALPDTVFIGYREAGNDQNYMLLAASYFSGENTSFFMGSTKAWRELNGTQLSATTTVTNATLPIRATFLTRKIVAIDDETTLPEQIELLQNYPNPFNPTTTIQYHLPTSGHVRLLVYDTLGRLVETMVDQPQVAGTYSVQLQAKNWPSGLYFYTIESGSQRFSKRMILIK
ncbi:MAG: T9SS type A sorting domain-containing protein [Bacteroidetes Order II. Incertae sedis bacterium]|nr:T9SS type A sorting domain-containing protein [Bacteroidetes Order II. bacterium]